MLKRFSLPYLATYLLCICLLYTPATVHASTSSAYPIHDIMTDIVEWKAAFLDSDYILKSNSFLKNVGESSYNDYAFTLSRLGTDRGYDSYLSLLYNKVSSIYAKEPGTSSLPLLEWQKTTLTILALGGSPNAMTNTINETTINLLADYCYNYPSKVTIEEMDTKSLSYMLLTMNALDYSIPESSVFTRKRVLAELLSRQRTDGSFSSKDYPSDSSATALAIQALAPFYNDGTHYDTINSRSAREVIKEALAFLSSRQTKNGDIRNGPSPSLESTAQTLSACASMGIDPYTDHRFLRNDHNLLDGLMRYQNSDGGFTASLSEETVSASEDASSILALNSLISFYRYRHNQRDLYDMRAEFSPETKALLLHLNEEIALLSPESEKADVAGLYEDYLSLSVSDRRYVYQYEKLERLLDRYGISKDTTPFTLSYNRLLSNSGTLYNIILNQELTMTKTFTNDDYYRYLDLPEVLTLTNYNMVTELYCKLINTDAETFGLTKDPSLTYEMLLKSLKAKKSSLEISLAKIDSINTQIETTLSSFQHITKEDKDLIDRLVYQASTIHPLDQKQIVLYNELLKAQEQLSPKNTKVKISGFLLILFLLLLIPIFYQYMHQDAQAKKDSDTNH